MAIVGTVRPPKMIGEKLPVSVNFSGRLASGETISSATVTSRNEATDASSSGTFLTGTHTITNGVISHKVHQGAEGETHLLTFTATTSAGNVRIAEVRVPVTDD